MEMKLMVLGDALFRTEEDAREKLWIFLKSCERWGIKPYLHGFPSEQFTGWPDIRLVRPAAWLKENAGDFTHVLHTNAWDVMFLAGFDEIIEKYKAYGSPQVLVSAFFQLPNAQEKDYPGVFSHENYYCFPSGGQCLAEIPYLIDAYTRFPKRTGDDAHSWYDAIQEGWFKPVLDHKCEVFNLLSEHNDVRNGRLYNRKTDSYPSSLHISGGYTDQVYGKNDRMVIWARKLGIL